MFFLSHFAEYSFKITEIVNFNFLVSISLFSKYSNCPFVESNEWCRECEGDI